MAQKTWPYRIFDVFFGLAFAGLFLLSLLRHDNPFLPLNTLPLAAVCLIWLGVFAAALFFWHRFGKAPKRPVRLLVCWFCVLFAVQLALGLLLSMGFWDTWDFPLVANAARRLVTEGSFPAEYLSLFSNNGPLFWLFAGIFKLVSLFGITDFVTVLVVVNILFIDCALLFLYLCAETLLGSKWALPVLAMGSLHPALLLYLPVTYTDTLTLPFVTGGLWLWLRARQRFHRQERALPCAAGAFALLAAGAVFKVSVAILAVAMILDLLCFWRGRGRFRILALCLLCLLVVLPGGNALNRAAIPETADEGIPFTHWIMMGLNGKGGYCDEDYQTTLQYATYEERLNFTVDEIGRRLNAMGTGGFVQHCLDKLSYIISDGTYYAPAKLDYGPRYINLLHKFIISGEPYAGLLYYLADGLQLCLLALCAAGGFYAAWQGRSRTTLLRVALFGLLLFLLIWEARSRYLVNFIPLFLLCAADVFDALPPCRPQTNGSGKE